MLGERPDRICPGRPLAERLVREGWRLIDLRDGPLESDVIDCVVADVPPGTPADEVRRQGARLLEEIAFLRSWMGR